MKMQCPKCNSKLRKVKVSTEGAKSKVLSYQCPNCDYYEFDQESAKKVLKELEEAALSLEHKFIKLSKGRLGMYFNKDIIRSLGLKSGETAKVSVPDKKHIVLTLE